MADSASLAARCRLIVYRLRERERCTWTGFLATEHATTVSMNVPVATGKVCHSDRGKGGCRV